MDPFEAIHYDRQHKGQDNPNTQPDKGLDQGHPTVAPEVRVILPDSHQNRRRSRNDKPRQHTQSSRHFPQGQES